MRKVFSLSVQKLFGQSQKMIFFLKKCFSKCSSGHVECSSDNHAENFPPENFCSKSGIMIQIFFLTFFPVQFFWLRSIEFPEFWSIYVLSAARPAPYGAYVLMKCPIIPFLSQILPIVDRKNRRASAPLFCLILSNVKSFNVLGRFSVPLNCNLNVMSLAGGVGQKFLKQ